MNIRLDERGKERALEGFEIFTAFVDTRNKTVVGVVRIVFLSGIDYFVKIESFDIASSISIFILISNFEDSSEEFVRRGIMLFRVRDRLLRDTF